MRPSLIFVTVVALTISSFFVLAADEYTQPDEEWEL
jgi:hypothetical protein